jgi:AraC-like DNA-binding protein
VCILTFTWVYKLKIESKSWKNDNFEGISLFKASFQNFKYTKHWHDELTIGIILDGIEGIDYRSDKLIVGKGDIIALNPSEVHTGFTCNYEGWSSRMFYFDMDFISTILQEINYSGKPFIENPIIFDEDLYISLKNLHFSFETNCFKISHDILLVSIIHRLFTEYGSKKLHSNSFTCDSYNNFKMREYLTNNYSRDISLLDLCNLTGMSKYNIIKSFKQEFNITPHQYMIITRINKAKFLIEKNMDITEASLKCGFYDLSHMSRNFKKVFGVSPGKYSNLEY